MPSLLDTKLFREIEDRLNAMTPEKLSELVPGGPVPEDAVILGVMSDPLKSLLVLLLGAIQWRENCFQKLIKEGATYPPDEIKRIRQVIRKLDEQVNFYDYLFLQAVDKEYGEAVGEAEVRFGSKYEVYIVS